ncbi:hypothetical protein BU14_0147s0025 [Porphyra umbilicalis]|uniref:Uncharacterized protein n=1 Tax=Porphyra umbilicalis TaxID=2786 RepID=A0A1X6P9Q4_PORUM|nr:hypothetical protein BU14_0147s0025 [Porphyra umbilicalis]|eukprot:OSX77500.1 hypothetical protein BU14_0147s0025 [Porphyra umbilicalis]
MRFMLGAVCVRRGGGVVHVVRATRRRQQGMFVGAVHDRSENFHGERGVLVL